MRGTLQKISALLVASLATSALAVEPVELILRPVAPAAAPSAWELHLACGDFTVSSVRFGVAAPLGSTFGSIGFGMCGPQDPSGLAPCTDPAGLGPTVDASGASFTVGPFDPPPAPAPTAGVLTTTLYAFLTAPPGATLCDPVTSPEVLLVSPVSTALPGPILTRQGAVTAIPEPVPAAVVLDGMGVPIANEDTVLTREGTSPVYSLRVRPSVDSSVLRWEVQLDSTTELHRLSFGVLLPKEATVPGVDVVFKGCDVPMAPPPRNTCVLHPDLGPTLDLDPMVTFTVGPELGLPREDVMYVTVEGNRATGMATSLNPLPSVRLGVIEFSAGLAFVPEHPVITYEGVGAVLPPSENTNCGMLPDPETNPESNESKGGGGGSLDTDLDTMGDDQDNCPVEANGPPDIPPFDNWENVGGVGTNANIADTFGDKCQCGDSTGDGKVLAADVTAIRQALADPSVTLGAQANVCNVIGEPPDTTLGPVGVPLDCDIVDVVVLTRNLELTPLPPAIEPVCDPAYVPP